MRILSLPLALALAALACAQPGPEGTAPPSEAPAPSAERPALFFFSPDPQTDPVETTAWVKIYDPQQASNGYTLAFFKRRIPMLVDMNGRVVHAWPAARTKSRLRLLPDGHLLAIALGRGVVEYDWEGNTVWEHRIEGEIPHHDVVRMANGNTMLVLRSKTRPTDLLVEVTPDGEVAWEWDSAVHLEPWFEKNPRNSGDMTHINGVQELPENPWFEAGDARFRPGNLLVSARNLNAIFILDRQSGEAVWSYEHQLDLQHEALMIGPDFPRPGRILIFNNGYRGRWEYRKSTIVEIDPTTAEITWEYRSDDFYSPTGGIEQPLPNGNLLISSSRGGRAFEVTREGEIVWQWVPPFDPNRPHRVAWDHCPQLAAMERPAAIPVRPTEAYRYVDPAVYQFSRRGARRSAVVNGQKRSILRRNNFCSKLFLPAEATVEVAYGLNRTALRSAGRSELTATFGLRLRRADGEEIELLRETVDLQGVFRRRSQAGLAEHAFEWVELCVSTELAGAASDPELPLDDFVYWLDPRISGAGGRNEPLPEDDATGLTDEELEVQKEHLKALGYVD